MKTPYDEFAETYDQEFGDLTNDVGFWVALSKGAQPPVLELACGTGRVAIPIAQAGVPVVGVDSSKEMLARAQDKADMVDGLPLNLVQADMRTFSLDEQFGLAIVAANSFLHLIKPEDQRRALANIRRHLCDSGLLAIHVFVPDVRKIAADAGASSERPLRFRREFVDPLNEQRVVVWESRRYDTHRQRIWNRFVYERLDESGLVVQRSHRTMELCYIWKNEMQYLLELTGFEVEDLYSGFEREPFVPDSTAMVWMARKA